MTPLEFSPLLPWLCLSLALLAPALVAGRARLGPHRSWLPAGWTGADMAGALVVSAASLILILMHGPLLEWASARLLRLGAGGRTLAEPQTWLAAATVGYAEASRLAWRALLLGGPLALTWTRALGVRWPGRASLAGAAVAVAPLPALALATALPPEGAGPALLLALLLTSAPLLGWLGARALLEPSRAEPRGWRPQEEEIDEPTRVSAMPAALAASLGVGSGRTTGVVRVIRPRAPGALPPPPPPARWAR